MHGPATWPPGFLGMTSSAIRAGSGRLEWTQGKTGTDRVPGELWPEIGEILDELILAGRPRRYAGLWYQQLVGRNWLTHTMDAMPSRHPSYLVRQAIGVPLHDLRTVIADFMRRVDPERAADIIATLLGHTSTEAGDEYRASAKAKRQRETGAAERDRPGLSRVQAANGERLAPALSRTHELATTACSPSELIGFGSSVAKCAAAAKWR